jgi:hypothetical protein
MGSILSRNEPSDEPGTLHLRLWHAKYEAWIPGHPRHALVYLADEEQHGIGFPGGLDQVVDEVLRELDARAAPNRRLHPTAE